MAKHLQKRNGVYFARLGVPQQLRSLVGKTEYLASLRTSDKKIAEIRAMKQVAKWKEELFAYRGASQRDREALELRFEAAGNTNPDSGMSDKEYYIDSLSDEMQPTEAQRFRLVAEGRFTPFIAYLDRFMSQWEVADKTKNMARTAIRRVNDNFPNLEDLTTRSVMIMIESDTTAVSTKRKNYGFVSQYWEYLNRLELTGERRNPFQNQKFSGSKSAKRNRSWKAFRVDEVEDLYRHARAAVNGLEVSDLIKFGAYTGARIDEICTLQRSDVKVVDGVNCFEIKDAKTNAGNRLIPVHPQLESTLKRMMADSSGHYIFNDLTTDKYGSRSNAIGKAFGRMKKNLGYDELHVFHSIRKTVTTTFENAGISEGLAAEILGHEKTTMTFGVYSAGHTVQKKKEAIETLLYTFES